MWVSPSIFWPEKILTLFSFLSGSCKISSFLPLKNQNNFRKWCFQLKARTLFMTLQFLWDPCDSKYCNWLLVEKLAAFFFFYIPGTFWYRVTILGSLKYRDQAHYFPGENTFYICSTKTHQYKSFLQSERALSWREAHALPPVYLLCSCLGEGGMPCLQFAHKDVVGLHQPLLPSTSWLPWDTWLCQEPVLLCFPGLVSSLSPWKPGQEKIYVFLPNS